MRETFLEKFLIGCQFGGMETLSETFSTKFLGKVSHVVKLIQLRFLGNFLIGAARWQLFTENTQSI